MPDEMEHVEILLVEDNPADAELTIRALKKRRLSNRVHHVKDGVEALEFLKGLDPTAVPRVILLDLKLPRLDGLQVLEKLKSADETRAIPVVVLTSSQEDRDLDRAYALGANSYIVKPVEFEKFMDCVEQLGMYWALLNQPPKSRS